MSQIRPHLVPFVSYQGRNKERTNQMIIKEEEKKKHILTFVTASLSKGCLNCPSSKHQGTFATGKIRPNIKFASFWCVFLTKIKVDPESWLKKTLD